jgi:hypothetical protein
MKRMLAVLLATAALGAGGCLVSVRPATTSFRRVEGARLYSVRYDEAGAVLTVVLRGGDVFDFRGVPPEVHRGLLKAESPDTFYGEQVEGKFESTKLSF